MSTPETFALLFAVVQQHAVNDASNQAGKTISALVDLHEMFDLELASVDTDAGRVDFREHFWESYRCILL